MYSTKKEVLYYAVYLIVTFLPLYYQRVLLESDIASFLR